MPNTIELSAAVWSQFAALAYAGYVARGRGAVIIDVLPLVSPGPKPASDEKYLTFEELKTRDWMSADALGQLEAYDPATQIVVVGRRLDGSIQVSTHRAADGPSPKEAYEQFAKSQGLTP